MVDALQGEFIQAAGYSRGRPGDVNWVVVHSAEGSTEGRGLGNYFAGTRAGSSHAGIDDNDYWAYVTYNNTAWTNPPINSRSDTLELCAFRAWSRDEWLNHSRMLELCAHWIAWRCAVRGIPVRLVTGAQAAAGMKGVLDHKRVNDGFHKSDHTDVGPNFPWDVVMPRAQEIAGVASTSPAMTSQRMAGKDRWLGLQNPPLRDLPGTPDVTGVQHALAMCGNDLTLDGCYGLETARLIHVFQEHRNILERGVGPKTWAALRVVAHGG